MNFSFAALLSQLWPLAAAAVVIGYFVSRGSKQRRDVQVARDSSNARELDMGYEAPSGAGVRGLVDQGTHRFSGTTGGVPWIAEVMNLASEVDDGLATRGRVSLSYTRWTATQAGTVDGTLLLMTLPDGVRVPPVGANAGGFLAALASKAAWAALQVYIRGHFGNARVEGLSLAPEQRLPLPSDDFGLTFVAFGDRPELLQRLSPPARDWLLNARDARAAFLWDAEGLTLSWRQAYMKAEEVAECAEYGAHLAGLLGTSHILRPPGTA